MSSEIGHVSHWAAMWSLVAQMNAAVAVVESMKAANEERNGLGAAQAYGEEAFVGQANIIMEIANLLKRI